MRPKILTLLCSFIFMAAWGYGQDFFNSEVNDINGKPVSLRQFAGKKTLIYILPSTLSDSLKNTLSDFRDRISDSVFIVGAFISDTGVSNFKSTPDFGGAVNFDELFDFSNSQNLQNSSKSFLGWLREKKLNGYGDIGQLHPETFFVVNEYGRLIAFFSSKTHLGSPIVFKTLSFVKPIVAQ